MTVLILTCQEDVTADMVVYRLNSMRYPVLRLDPADLPGEIGLTIIYGDGGLAGEIACGSRAVGLSEITSVWVRRPGRPGQAAEVQQRWVGTESDHALYGALRALPARWMNHPDATAAARYKTVQCTLARAVGFSVPETLVTTSPGAAKSFAARQPVVGKTVSGVQPDDMQLPTTPVPPTADLSGVSAAPTCLQQQIDKVADIRLTSIGGQQFSARIETGEVDWRFQEGEEAPWREVATPDDIRSKVMTFMDVLGLVYGAFDFAVDADGTWYFLEVNPSGQFGFVEHATGQPISQAIADWLAGKG